MTTLIAALCCMGLLGIAFGVGLAVASKRFHVDTDPRIDQVYEALPHIDCGACGYGGCQAYAEAVVLHDEAVDLCVPGGEETAQEVADIMGVELASTKHKSRAVCLCQGGLGVAAQEAEYSGVDDCRAAQLVQGGPKVCKYGCLGFGTCAKACPFDAITMSEDRLPVIDEDKCTACGVCVRTCPVHILTILPSQHRVFMACSNPEHKGKTMKQMCSRGCIKCRLCVKVTESGAITWGEEGLPAIDFEQWTDPDMALEKCPMGCFVDQREGAAEAREAAG
ncbi:MAG: RnfABCDGE type electron transport complex subunit B [Planctomycetota bacterium]